MNINSNLIFSVVQDSQVSLLDIFLTVLIAFGLGMLIAQVYKKTFKGISYSKSFVTTIVMLTPITSIVMLTIGSNLARAFGLVGALSIIRFRTVIKDTKDITTVFLSLVTGLAVGTLNYHIAILGALLILLFTVLLDKIDYGAFSNHSFLVSFVIPQDKLNESDYKDIIEKHSGEFNLMNISVFDTDKDEMEVTYKIGDVSMDSRQELAKELGNIKGIKSITIVSANNFVEY